MATTKRGKVMVLIAGVFFVLLIGLVAIVSVQSRLENKKFLTEGVRVPATILSLDKYGTRKSPTYQMKVSMFIKGPERKVVTDTTGKSKSEKLIDSIFDRALSGVGVNDDYQTAVIAIGSSAFHNHRLGDRVEVVYLKENPKEVKLVEEIDEI